MKKIYSISNALYNKKIIGVLRFSFAVIFWSTLSTSIIANYMHAASFRVFTDVHFPFFGMLTGLASRGYYAGIDIVNTHGVLTPFIVGVIQQFFGQSLVDSYIVGGIFAIVRLYFIFRTSRLVLSKFWSYCSIFLLAVSYTGGQFWFNEVFMTFLCITTFYLASYIVGSKKTYKLIVIGFIVFLLPLIRQQGILISLAIILIPTILYYLKVFPKNLMIKSTEVLLSLFIILNILFIIFLLVNNKFEIFYITFFKMPTIGMVETPHGIAGIIFYLKCFFDYTYANVESWTLSLSLGYFSYWLIVIIPCIYFIYKIAELKLTFNLISRIDAVRFIVALLTLLTIVFNYPFNDNHRHLPQYSLGFWLFADALLLTFYNQKIKMLSFTVIIFIMLCINMTKINYFYEFTKTNINDLTSNEVRETTKYPKGSAFSGYFISPEIKKNIDTELAVLAQYDHNNITTIYEGSFFQWGETATLPVAVFLFLSAKNIAVQNTFPIFLGGGVTIDTCL